MHKCVKLWFEGVICNYPNMMGFFSNYTLGGPGNLSYFQKLQKGKTVNAQIMLSLMVKAWSDGASCNYPNMRGFQ